MNIPEIITQSEIRALASPSETHAVRVILHEVPYPGQFRLRTLRRQYLFERDGIAEVHLLDIPVSVWMHDVPTGQLRDNTSISQDFRSAGAVKWSFQIVPLKGATPAIAAEQAHFLPLLREILRTIEAPPVVEEAFKLIDAGNLGELQDLAAFLKSTAKADGPSPAAAERARKMREAKAAKQAEREATAKLQPA
jgi:hypothetical protein